MILRMFVVGLLTIAAGMFMSAERLSTAFAETCGNGVCDAGETKQSCPQDCRKFLKLLRQHKGERTDRPARSTKRAKPPTLGAGDSQESLMADGHTRTYLLHVPPSDDSTRPKALVLVFHGGYGSGGIAAGMSGFSSYADREGFIVAYPDGIERSWNDGRGTTTSDQQNIDDVAFVSHLMDHLLQRFAIDESRIYAAGMSNGAIFSFRLGCELSHRLAAIAAVAGMMAESIVPNCAPQAPLSVLILKGTQDPLTPYEGGRTRKGKGGSVLSASKTAAWWAQRNGCQATPATQTLRVKVDDGTSVEETTYAQCRDASAVVLYTVKGMGHAWPPKEPHAPRLSGPTSRNIDATEAAWEFFKTHPKAQGAIP